MASDSEAHYAGFQGDAVPWVPKELINYSSLPQEPKLLATKEPIQPRRENFEKKAHIASCLQYGLVVSSSQAGRTLSGRPASPVTSQRCIVRCGGHRSRFYWLAFLWLSTDRR